jgi:23S rRNA (cytidine1920-2'-O)/16S rRNA (cytidine1409-2'-O)-methyltransferase
MRIDQLLVATRPGHATRSQAQRLIAAGVLRWLDDATRPGRPRGQEWRRPARFAAELELLDTAGGALCLARRAQARRCAAFKATGLLDVAGFELAWTSGQSTGGFTDCLLQHGAAHVTGVDVGHEPAASDNPAR